MATLYNKTALKKIKKADLIQMFLEQQGEKNYLVMENDEFKQRLIEKNDQLIEANKKLMEANKERIEENQKQIELTKENKKLHESFDGWTATLEEYKMLKVENKKLKDTIVSLKSSVDDLREARDMRDQQINELMSKDTLQKQYKDYFDKWSEILRDIDGDDFADLLKDYGWEYNDEGNLVKVNEESESEEEEEE